MKKTLLGGVAIAAAAGFGATQAAADDFTFINIGTAGIGGGFYPAGGAICNMVNASRDELGHNIRCTVESTAGSVANLRSIAIGDLDIALSQSDWQYHAFNGTSDFEDDGPNEDLRFLFSVQFDAFQLVAHPDSGIESFDDLEGKVVNTGNVGSGTEATLYRVFEQYGLDPDETFAQETKLTAREQAQALCDGNIDAFIYPSGLPGASITEATSTCDAVLLSWWDDTLEGLVDEFPYYGRNVVPAGTYPGQDEDVTTLGILTTVVASADVDEDVVYTMVKSVFDNWDAFQQQTPLFQGVTRESSSNNGQTAPYHDGALRYFEEAGLVE